MSETFKFENFPAELREQKLWVNWRLEDSDKRERCKKPYVPHDLSTGASSTNPENWSTFDKAVASQLLPVEKYKDEPYSRGVGFVLANGYIGVDLDKCYDGATTTEFARRTIDALPKTYTELSPSRKGFHLIYKLPEGHRPEKSGLRTKQIEVYFRERYFTVTGWYLKDEEGRAYPVHHLTADEVTALVAMVEASRGTKSSATVPTYSSAKFSDYMTRHDFADLSAVVHALVVMLLRKHKLDRAAAEAEFKTSSIYKNTHWKDKWERLGRDELTKCEPLAKEWLERDERRLSDSAIYGPHQVAGKMFLEMFGDDWRYDWTVKLWRHYQDGRWVKDEKWSVLGEMNKVTERLLEDAKTAGVNQKALLKIVTALSNFDTRDKSVKWVRNESPVSTKLGEYDLSPWLFNCTNGTYDLEYNEFREHRRADLLTKSSPVTYDATALCPVFDKFLARVLPDQEVRDSLQEFAGYTLSGISYLKFFFLLHGIPDTGKTTVIEIFRHIYGDYAATLSFKGLAPHEGQNAPEVVGLRGARFASAVESEQNKKLDSALLKLLTGGRDRIKAAEKFQNPVEFDATHKIWLASNWPPMLDSNDDALWRRLLKVSFSISIPLNEQDGQLLDKLKAEASGILNWMIAGWLRISSRTPLSLAIPDAVKVATQALRDETDPIREWFDAHCTITDSASDRLYMPVAFESFNRCSKGKFGYTSRGFTDHLVKRILCRRLDDKDGKRGSYFVKVRLNELQSQF